MHQEIDDYGARSYMQNKVTTAPAPVESGSPLVPLLAGGLDIRKW